MVTHFESLLAFLIDILVVRRKRDGCRLARYGVCGRPGFSVSFILGRVRDLSHGRFQTESIVARHLTPCAHVVIPFSTVSTAFASDTSYEYE